MQSRDFFRSPKRRKSTPPYFGRNQPIHFGDPYSCVTGCIRWKYTTSTIYTWKYTLEETMKWPWALGIESFIFDVCLRGIKLQSRHLLRFRKLECNLVFEQYLIIIFNKQRDSCGLQMHNHLLSWVGDSEPIKTQKITLTRFFANLVHVATLTVQASKVKILLAEL